MNGDVVNACFELGGAILCWRNAWQLYKDREVKGVYWPVTGFFACFGLWNLYYYPSLGQWLSFYAGVILCAGNCAWVAGVFYLRWKAFERAEPEIGAEWDGRYP